MGKVFRPVQRVRHSTDEMKHLVSQQPQLSNEGLLLIKTLCFWCYYNPVLAEKTLNLLDYIHIFSETDTNPEKDRERTKPRSSHRTLLPPAGDRSHWNLSASTPWYEGAVTVPTALLSFLLLLKDECIILIRASREGREKARLAAIKWKVHSIKAYLCTFLLWISLSNSSQNALFVKCKPKSNAIKCHGLHVFWLSSKAFTPLLVFLPELSKCHKHTVQFLTVCSYSYPR